MQWDAMVIGAGAAGMFCAGILGQRGQRVLLIDHAEKLGEKIRISGGGRCNFTNLHSRPEHFLSLNPGFVDGAIRRYPASRFIDLVRRYRIAFHEKHRGQLFCDGASTQIVDMLLAECRLGRVTVRHPVSVAGVQKSAQGWQVNTGHGQETAPVLVLATGGLPVPAIGATAFALDLARSLDIPVVQPRPGLVPLSFTSEGVAGFDELAGISLPVAITAGHRGERYGTARFQEDLLITHKGLSGPAVLQASSYWQEGETIDIDWSHGLAWEDCFHEARVGGRHAESVLAEMLPARLAKALCRQARIPERKWAEIAKADRLRLRQWVTGWRVKPAGTLGWKKAEVMVGGIDTRALDADSMMAKAHPGLYCIGECVDVTGHLGGHNFQWAWASGHACAMSITSAGLKGS